jgi:hypothetical protein
MVTNLAGMGGGLVLQGNNQDNLLVNANGAFTFPTPLASGSSYSVTVHTQPSSPSQTCGIVNGAGTATANVTNVLVNCSRPTASFKRPILLFRIQQKATSESLAFTSNVGGGTLGILFVWMGNRGCDFDRCDRHHREHVHGVAAGEV